MGGHEGERIKRTTHCLKQKTAATVEMSTDTEALEEARETNTDDVALPSAVDPLLIDTVRSLPSNAVKDLLSLGVCIKCVLRLLGIHHGDVHCLSASSIFRVLQGDCLEGLGGEDEVCCVCFGVLDFALRDDGGLKKRSINEFVRLIVEAVRREGHEIDGFALEVSLPAVIADNENKILVYMKKEYGLEDWFKNMNAKCLSVKDALKLGISSLMENLLGVKSGPSSYRIRLTYTHSKQSSCAPNSVYSNGGNKRRKTEAKNGSNTIGNKLLGATAECCDSSGAEKMADTGRSSDGLRIHASSECFDLPIERVKEAYYLAILCYRTSIYFGGRYLKFSRNVSQTRWIIDDERMGEASVEEIIGRQILPICLGDSYKFHAAGREDIDVRMLGSGRPFLVEIQNARKVPSEALVKDMETDINNLGSKLVGVKNLKLATSNGWDLMHEGGAEKQKQYCALVWISRPLEDIDLHSIASLKDMQIIFI